MQSLSKSCILLVVLIVGVKCLFEDQAGTYDWRQQHVGKPLYSHVDFLGKKFFVATDQNLLSALNIKNGNIAWRKIFESNENGKIEHVLWGTNEIIVITGNGQKIQSFNYANGFANWEYVLFNKNDLISRKFSGIESKRESESFYFTDGHQLCYLGFKEKICIDVPKDGGYRYDTLFQTSNGIYVVGFKENSVQKIQYNFQLSNIVAKTVSPLNGQLKWLTPETKCSQLSDSDQLVCVSTELKKIFVQKFDNQIVFNEYELPNDITKQAKLVWASNDKFAFESNKQSHLKDDYKNIDLIVLKLDQEMRLTKVKKIESTANYNLKTKDAHSYIVYAKYNQNDLTFNVLSLTSDDNSDHVVKVVSDRKEPTGILQLNGNIVENKNGQTGLLTFCFFSDYRMSIFSTQGLKYFTREESLAYISSVEMVDFPQHHLQEEFEDEFGNSNNDNIVSMFIKRIRSQALQLKEFILYDLYHKIVNLINSNNPNKRPLNTQVHNSELSVDELTRDEFNLNKIIVVATTIGKVFGIYTSANGQVLWSFYLKNTMPFVSDNKKNKLSVSMFLQRSAAHVPHEPQAVFISKYESGSDEAKTLVHYFNPLNGQASKGTPETGIVLDYGVKQAFLSNVADSNDFLKALMLLDSQNKLHVLPEKASEDLLTKTNKLNVVYTVNMENKDSLLTGYSMLQSNEPLPELWRVKIEDENILAIGSKHPHDRIHSHGKVLGDRSVLYKYLNPNLIGVVTTGLDNQKIPFINVYLIDTVTGAIVNSFNHKRCTGPVNIVHTENWFFYSYYNIKYRRFEVTSVEIFEGSSQFNSTTFSSLDDIKPVFYSKSYVVQRAFNSMQVTLTEKGITTKDVIVACQSGVIIEIPWILIDPRRPIKMTEVEKEENLLPYMPEIPLNYEFSLNYYNYVYNVRGIATASSGLESTSLIFAYGLDIYFTRVFPSKTFDLLREDFDYLFVSTLMFGLLIGTFLSKKLASSSNLGKAWK